MILNLFLWIAIGVTVSGAYAYLSNPRVERPTRCIVSGVVFALAGGLLGTAAAAVGMSTDVRATAGLSAMVAVVAGMVLVAFLRRPVRTH